LLSSKRVIGLAPDRVSPFGHPGINACVPLPLAYRSLPRPSSPPCAQAFPTCLRSLDYTAVCVKQSTRDLTIGLASDLSSDNLFEIDSLSIKIHKSAIYQSIRCQTAATRITPQSAASQPCNRIWEGMSRRATYGTLSAHDRIVTGLLEISVKEVIQPQVPLRLPCYDFAPVTALAFGRLAPCGFRHGLRALTASMA
jgi:hypothetical protein